MGFDTDIKFSGYELVQGIDPVVLVENEWFMIKIST
jgi:hypothetical protein